MLRKSSSGRGAPPEADKTAGGSRSWAAMRARLRQGREPILGDAAGEPPPAAKSTPATNSLGLKTALSERPARPAGPISAPASPPISAPAAPTRPAAQHDGAVAAHDPTVSRQQQIPAPAPSSTSNHQQAPPEAAPRTNGADHKAANGPAHGGHAPAPAPKPDADVSA